MSAIASVLIGAVIAAGVPTAVRITPGAQTWPATTLRLYVTFDRPARGLVDQNAVKLYADDGTPLPGAFMDFGQPLWSPDGRRLTVLFDPGRVKRGVVDEVAAAAPLHEGSHYRIEVGALRHRFAVGPANRTPLDPTAWKIVAPRHRADSLVVVFDRVMDDALVGHELRVRRGDGRWVPGSSRLDREGSVWRFWPAAGWSAGSYALITGDVLEDVSGNRVDEAFDRDRAEDASASTAHALTFSVGPPAPRGHEGLP